MCDGALRALVVAGVVATSCSSAPAPPAPPPAAPVPPAPELPSEPALARRSASEFMTGDECLFCHREKIGSSWERNLHNRTMRDAGVAAGESEAPEGAELALGARAPARWLKRAAGYGVLAVYTAAGEWDESAFGEACAGCHASGVDPENGAFAAVSLDCFVCHGDVALEHTNDPARVHLSPRRDEEALVVTSICGQCHLRGGRSRQSGRPWPSGFVAGDLLLGDFEFDFSDAALAALSIADRHVAENVRDVFVKGRTAVTCLSCHSVHGESTRAHRLREETALCFTCHVRGEPRSRRHAFTRSNPLCDVNGGT